MTSKATVTCRDGKVRVFKFTGTRFGMAGRKYIYWLAGDFTYGYMVIRVESPTWGIWLTADKYRAPSKYQPVRIEAETPDGKWVWEKVE